MNVVAVVHAKGKSERLPNKNLRKLGGKPLICHAITTACNNSLIRDVYIDSEDDTILKVGTACGALPLKRPPYLANNSITGDDLAYWQAQSLPQYDIIVQVVPTSPFIKSGTISKCINNVLSGHNCSFTSSVEQLYTWEKTEDILQPLLPTYYKDGRLMNSNDLPKTYIEHTGLYVFKTEFAFIHRKRIDIHNYVAESIDKIEQIDINTEEDFKFAEVVWKGLHSSRTSIEISEDLLRALDQASIT
jgi:CMP-N-acetylneuraminic acid synthetase